MASRYWPALLGLALLSAHPARAAEPPPPPIRVFELPDLQKMGVALYRQDLSAWRATDALRAKVPDLAGAGVKGWLVEDDGKVAKVRFLRDLGQGLEAGYDVEVTSKGAGPVVEPADRTLTDEERTMFAARQTAMANLPPSLCRPGYNSAIVKDPDGDGWLVWLLAPSPAAGAIPVGGHYRFTISADGKTLERRDALSASCLVLPPQQLPAGAKAQGMLVNHIISPSPVETHVFLSLLYRQPFFVQTGKDQIWVVAQGQIAPVQVKR
ncbi:hypothetical protein [Caulobacter segnis]